MYQQLNSISLKSGEVVQAGVVQGPDLDWAERVETLLRHKGPSWRWGNEQVLRTLIAAGFRCCATLKQRVAADRAQTGWVDVEVWERLEVMHPT